MSGMKELPRSARRFIYVVLVLAAGAVAYRAPDLGQWAAKDLLALLGLTAALVVGEQFILHLKHRTESMNFSVTDATFAAALFLVRPSVLTMAVGAGVLIGHSLRGWKPYKIAFNVGNFLIAITAAELVFDGFPTRPVTDATSWISVSVAMFAFFVINAGTVAYVVSLVEGKSFGSVILPALPLDVVHWAGNLAIGVLGALVWEKERLALPLLVVPLVLSYSAYRAWLQGMRERDRMRSLYEAGHALYAPLTEEEYRPFIELVETMLDAQAVELVVLTGEHVTVHDADGTFVLTATPGEDGKRRTPEAYVR